ncbi:MAG: hypothetical protein LBD42_00270 [Desulfovibrio sp.]|jgi:hypothetical protein|nr:hypothetical protein [Desulfovibrio sp.]
MKDDKGLYYYPNPSDSNTRVYVRQGENGIEFRLWQSEHPEVWERHEWLVYDVLLTAASLYKERGRKTDPLAFYDLNVARALLQEAARISGYSRAASNGESQS